MESKSKSGFNIITAVDEKNGIGRSGVMPWSLKTEYQYFLDTINYRDNKSKKNGFIWGSSSFKEFVTDSKPNDRIVTVLTRNKQRFIESNSEAIKRMKEGELVIFEDFDDALKYLSTNECIENIWCCGGGMVYQKAISKRNLQKIFITRIFRDFECNVFFPQIDLSRFKKDENYKDAKIHDENGLKFQYQLYTRL